MMKNTIWLFLFLPALFCGCEKWNLKEEVFLQVDLFAPETISIDSLRLTAELKDFTGGQVKTHGFLWTTANQVPTINSREGTVDLGLKTRESANLTYSAEIQLEPNKEYILRAFASLDVNEYVYSEAISYTTGNAMVFSEGIVYEFGPSLTARGRISGMDKGFEALEHGFCWSIDNSLPTVDDDVINLGERRNNESFETEIDQLVNNIQHYIRAYAVVTKDSEVETLYGEVMEFDGNLKSTWTLKANVPGAIREGAVAFAIGNNGYVGQGNGSSSFWQYNQQSDSWEETANFPGVKRWGAVGFSIGNKGYIATGMRNDNGSNQPLKDLWEYDPQTDSWEEKAPLPGSARVRAVGFSIGDKGYLGTGWNGGNVLYGDLWEYDPQTDSWEEKNSMPLEARFEAQGFSIGDKGYITMGAGLAGVLNDLWEYNPTSDSWNAKAFFPEGGRGQGASFTLDTRNIGYLVCGRQGIGGCEQEIWAYNPIEDMWSKEETNFPAVGRLRPIAFSIGDNGYFGTGGCMPVQYAWNDLWEYDP